MKNFKKNLFRADFRSAMQPVAGSDLPCFAFQAGAVLGCYGTVE
jgi:hypothetical protein